MNGWSGGPEPRGASDVSIGFGWTGRFCGDDECCEGGKAEEEIGEDTVGEQHLVEEIMFNPKQEESSSLVCANPF
jgi:hypothetical protein